MCFMQIYSKSSTVYVYVCGLVVWLAVYKGCIFFLISTFPGISKAHEKAKTPAKARLVTLIACIPSPTHLLLTLIFKCLQPPCVWDMVTTWFIFCHF